MKIVDSGGTWQCITPAERPTLNSSTQKDADGVNEPLSDISDEDGRACYLPTTDKKWRSVLGIRGAIPTGLGVLAF